MQFIISILSSLGFLFKPILNLFRSFKVIVNIFECRLDKPMIADGEGGFINGSYVQFKIEIINKKDKKFIINKIRCKAMCQGKILQDNIYCYDKDTYKKIAFRPTHEQLSILEIPPLSSLRHDVIFTSNCDLSRCDKLVFFYTKGIRQRKIVIWEKR